MDIVKIDGDRLGNQDLLELLIKEIKDEEYLEDQYKDDTEKLEELKYLTSLTYNKTAYNNEGEFILIVIENIDSIISL